MTRIDVTRQIPFPISNLWWVLDDYECVFVFDPSIKNSRLCSGPKTGLKATRICSMYDGSAVTESIIRYEPYRGYCIALYNHSFPFSDCTLDLMLSEKDLGLTELSLSMRYAPRFGRLGAWLQRWTIEPFMRRMLEGIGKGLEDHVRTGRSVGANGILH